MINDPTTPLAWRKSSYSADATNCVELADAGDTCLMRDSKHPDQGHLTFTSAELGALVAAAKAGELDDLQ
jgi:hypothetical protein